ncbi:ClpP/crotonase-like domain-containing protein [Fomitopsis betulina]|nr:ClpP/crotonase-like domain-containing protein [Fomitopsis betulina]
MSYPVRLPADHPIVTLTHPTAVIWLLELRNGEDSRINETLIDKALHPALDIVERDWRERWRAARATQDKAGGCGALVRGARTNSSAMVTMRLRHIGLELDKLTSDPARAQNFTPFVQNPFLSRLLAFPIPTIAAVNGHCFAAAMMVALCCDYRVMTDGSSRRAWMCMNEVALEGYRFTPPEALAAGLVDCLVDGNTDAVIAKAQALGESVAHLAVQGAWGVIKRDLYRDVLEATARDDMLQTIGADDAAAKARL